MRHSTLRLAIAVASSVHLWGCGPAEPAESPTVTAKPVSPASKLERVKKTYEGFSYEVCKDGENCAKLFASRASLDLGPSGKNALPNPRAHLPNPDERWIPEWQQLPTGEPGSHYVFEAMTLAAVHKTWRARCEEAYAEYDKELTSRIQAVDGKVAELAKNPNAYDRLAGILAIDTAKPDKAALGEFRKGSDPARYRYEVALFEAFEDTGRTFVYNFDGYAPSDELLAVIHPRQGKDYELEAFCLDASRGKIEGVPPLPDTSSWDDYVRSVVRLAVSDDRTKSLEKRRKELSDVAKAKFAKVKVPNPQLPPGVREITVPQVQTFKREGNGAVVISTITREDKLKLPSGKTKLSKIDDVAITTFADWPSGLELAPGDTVSFYGAELSVREVIVRSTTELEHRSREYKIEGKHVTRATSGGKSTVYFR